MFSIRYLNTVVPGLVSFDGTIKASLDGPDKVRPTKSMKALVKRKSPSLTHMKEPTVTTSTPTVDGLLSAFSSGQCHDRATMARKGAHVVIIHGPSSSLTQHACVDNNTNFLIPYSPQAGTTQKFAFIKDVKTYKATAPARQRSISDYNTNLNNLASGSVSLETFDLKDYPNGVLFVFKADESMQHARITKAYDTDEPMEHSKFEGIVLSHWHRHHEFFEADQDLVDLCTKVYGWHGFGNRKSVNSMGLNVYTGKWGSSRTIGNPV